RRESALLAVLHKAVARREVELAMIVEGPRFPGEPCAEHGGGVQSDRPFEVDRLLRPWWIVRRGISPQRDRYIPLLSMWVKRVEFLTIEDRPLILSARRKEARVVPVTLQIGLEREVDRFIRSYRLDRRQPFGCRFYPLLRGRVDRGDALRPELMRRQKEPEQKEEGNESDSGSTGVDRIARSDASGKKVSRGESGGNTSALPPADRFGKVLVMGTG